MRKLLLPFLFGFLFVWLFGGAWWYGQQNPSSVLDFRHPDQQIQTNKASIAPSFSIVDGDYALHVNEDISFFQSSYDAYIPERVNDALFDLTKHLHPSADKIILLTGKFVTGELNNSNFDNLGMARAEALKSRLIRLGFDGQRVSTQGIKVSHLESREGALFGAVTVSITNL